MRALIQTIWSVLFGLLGGLLISSGDDGGAVAVVGFCLAVTLGYWLLTERWFTARWQWLARLPGAFPQPRLKLGAAFTEEATVSSMASGPVGLGPFTAKFVKVPVSNEHGAQVAAEDVRAWLRFESPDHRTLVSRVQARWAHTKQPPERGPFAALDDPELNEVRIPPGSTRHVDVVAIAKELGGARQWTNKSMALMADPQFRIGADEFTALLTVSGSHTQERHSTIRVKVAGDQVELP